MVVVEPMDPARDLDAVMAIEAASFTNPWTREMFTWEIEHSDVARGWVLRTADDGVVGFCSGWLIFDELHIHTLAVRPDQRRRGHARALLDAVLRDAARQGARSATLEVRESNTPAVRLYEDAGFVVRGRRVGYYERPGEDALILWRDELTAPAGPNA
jgi:[ribosomal protein S18]-alanine N-acetyltransferase